MTGHEYEAVVAALVGEIRRNTPLAVCALGNGRANRVYGASGYAHQIDLSLRDDHRLFLVEMKHWRDPVDLEAVLVLAARLADIRGAEAGEVHASLVSTKHATRNARKVAAHLGIAIDIVQSSHEFALQFGSQHFVGITDVAAVTNSVDATVNRICACCGTRFTVLVDESLCGACAS